MGFSSPVHDVKGYTTSRPPLVLFVMCLLLFACATLAMAFYIQYANIVLNPEIRTSWKNFLSRLDSLNLCTVVSEQASDESVFALSRFIDGGATNSTSDESTTSITVAATVFLAREFKRFPPGMVAVTGSVIVDGVPQLFGSHSTLKMTFLVPQNLTETKYKDTCVIVTGPSWLLPLGRRSNVCVPSSINRTIAHVGALFAVSSNDTTGSCSKGSSIKLSFGSQSDDDFYLSKDERWNIYLRLIHVTYFLFILAVVFVCYSLLRGNVRSSVPKVDKMPLTL